MFRGSSSSCFAGIPGVGPCLHVVTAKQALAPRTRRHHAYPATASWPTVSRASLSLCAVWLRPAVGPTTGLLRQRPRLRVQNSATQGPGHDETSTGGSVQPLPPKVPVVCNGVRGELDTRDVTIRCLCPSCLQLNAEGVVWIPTDFRLHSGVASTKTWVRNVKVVLPDGPDGGKEIPFEEWLHSCGYTYHTTSKVVPGGPPPRQLLPTSTVTPKAVPPEAGPKKPRDVLPPKFAVMCNGIPGDFYTEDWKVSCRCKICVANATSKAAAGGSAGPELMSPHAWEQHCGSKAKRAVQAIAILPGQLPEIPSGAVPLSIKAFLARKGLRVDPRSTRSAADGRKTILLPLHPTSPEEAEESG